MNGEWGEAETRCAAIADVRVDDFIRFCEYAYRGDYTVPKCQSEDVSVLNGESSSHQAQQSKQKVYFGFEFAPEPAPEPEPEPEPAPEVAPVEPVPEEPPQNVAIPEEAAADVAPDDPWSFGTVTGKKKKKGKKDVFWDFAPPLPSSNKSALRTQLHGREYLIDGDPKAKILKQFRPKCNTTANQDFKPVFLAHARLYSFANEKLVAPLKSLTLHKLHRTLMDFKLYANRVNDILELARYAYNNNHTSDRNLDGTIDDLRKLVVEYIACEIDTIGKTGEFFELMEDGGEFVGDFWGVARKHLL